MTTPVNPDSILILAPVGRDAILLDVLLTQANCLCIILDPDRPPSGSLVAGVCLITQEALRPAFFATWSPIFTTQAAWSTVPVVMLVDANYPLALRQTLSARLGPDKPLTILERPVPARTLVAVLKTTSRLRQRQIEVGTLLTRLTVQNERLSSEVAAHQLTIGKLRQSEEHLQTLNAELEQRVAERTAELEQRNTELDEFAYVAAHDLKAPLQAIRQLTSWISEDAVVLPASSLTHITQVQRRVQRMEQMLDDLLAYARAGRQRYARERVDTAALIRAINEWLAPPPGFTIVAEDLPLLVAERVPLETVLRNLVGNAIKHHDRPQVGQVSIAAVDQGAFVAFSVTDDGPGIHPQYQERIFHIFQTLQPRDKVEGSGMGLAIVKKAVESRGGTITVKSQVGHGAIFQFTWPTTPA